MIKLSDNIKFYRERNDWTQQALADKINVSRAVISKWETGDTTPELSLLITLCDLFEVSLDYLVGRNFYKEDLLLEVNRIYRTNEKKVDEQMLEIINYLQQKPRMQQNMYYLSSLANKQRKAIEEIISVAIQQINKL